MRPPAESSQIVLPVTEAEARRLPDWRWKRVERLMACGSLEVRQRQLDQYVEGYQRFNPAASPGDLSNIRNDMESLIEGSQDVGCIAR